MIDKTCKSLVLLLTLVSATAFAADKYSLPSAQVPDGFVIWGNVVEADGWDMYSQFGVYAFDVTNAMSSKKLYGDYNMVPRGGGYFDDNLYRFVSFTDLGGGLVFSEYYEYNTDTWQETENSQQELYDPGFAAVCSAYDSEDGRLYGYFHNYDQDSNEDGYIFGWIDYAAMRRYGMVHTYDRFVAMASLSGELFAIGLDGNLYKVDKTSGKKSLVGKTGVKPSEQQQSAAAYGGTIYWAAMLDDGSSRLLSIDPSTAKASEAGKFNDNEQVLCLYVPTQVSKNAPDSVTALGVAFEKESLSGDIYFAMPEKAVNGSPLSGKLGYTIKAGDITLATGEAMPGEEVRKQIKVNSGLVSLKVCASNANGNGTVAVLNKWFGLDTPKAIGDIQLSISQDGVASLSWEAPTEGLNGGYVGEEYLTYSVKRMPEGVTVNERCTTTSFSERLVEEPYRSYYYEVTPSNGSLVGEASQSELVNYGSPFALPYVQTFDDPESLGLYTIIDANADGRTWRANEYAVRCTYNADKASDDWLITPPLSLKADRQYIFSFKAAATRPGVEECFEAGVGASENPADFRIVIPKTRVSDNRFKEYTSIVTVRDDGAWRFGIHAVSEAGRVALYADSIVVREGAMLAAPDSVTDFVVTPAPLGQLSATISMTAPRRLASGANLGSISRIELWRDDELVNVFDKPNPGSKLSFVDSKGLANKMYRYRAVAYNGAGAGVGHAVDAYVGIDSPLAPREVKLTDNGDGTVSLSWSAPGNIGVHGGYVDTKALHYNVYEIFETGVEKRDDAAGLAVPKVTLQIESHDYQDFVYLGVKACSAGGEGELGISNEIITGDVYTLPFEESFALGNVHYFWSLYATGDYSCGLTRTMASDGDKGSIYFVPARPGDESSIGTGKICLQGVEAPKLSFSWTADIAGIDARLSVRVKDNTYGEGDVATVIDMGKCNAGQWERAELDLSPWKDRPFVMIYFEFCSNNTAKGVYLDDVRICEAYRNDLAIALQAPVAAVAGQTMRCMANVTNTGVDVVDGFNVRLLSDGKVVATAVGQKILPGQTLPVVLDYNLSAAANDKLVIKAEVIFARDENPGNDSSEEIDIPVWQSSLPKLEGVHIESDGDKYNLRWDEAVTQFADFTESFDNTVPFNTGLGNGWSAADHSSLPTYSTALADYPCAGDPFAWIAMNPTMTTPPIDLEYYSQWGANSGNQCLMSFDVYSPDGTAVTTNHWLISPLLSGEAQTVSMYVKSLEALLPDEYEIWVSRRDNNPSSFTLLREAAIAPWEWKNVSFELPEGSMYFAIRAVSSDRFALMVDDVTFEPAPYNVLNYNVYRDGELYATVESNVLQHPLEADAPEHVYHVSAVYDMGESPLAEAAAASGIENVPLDGSVLIKSIDGKLHIDSYDGKWLTVSIHALDGRLLYEACRDNHVVNLVKGIYIVTANARVYKIMHR